MHRIWQSPWLRWPSLAAIRHGAHQRNQKDWWQRIYETYLERINELTGFDVAISLTRSVDAIICHLIDRALKSAGAPADWQEYMGFYAIGGYGRAEFNPQSDLDIMLFNARGQNPGLD